MLDKILKSIYKLSGNVSDNEKLQSYVELGIQADEFKIPDKILLALHAKLSKDGYVVTDNGKRFTITFEGILFLDRGSYVQQQKDLHSEQLKVRLTNKVLLIGSFLGGIYALVEILWKVVPLFLCFCTN